jgi:hypothetical protein
MYNIHTAKDYEKLSGTQVDGFWLFYKPKKKSRSCGTQNKEGKETLYFSLLNSVFLYFLIHKKCFFCFPKMWCLFASSAPKVFHLWTDCCMTLVCKKYVAIAGWPCTRKPSQAQRNSLSRLNSLAFPGYRPMVLEQAIWQSATPVFYSLA